MKPLNAEVKAIGTARSIPINRNKKPILPPPDENIMYKKVIEDESMSFITQLMMAMTFLSWFITAAILIKYFYL